MIKIIVFANEFGHLIQKQDTEYQLVISIKKDSCCL
jgi:hypothetical protein